MPRDPIRIVGVEDHSLTRAGLSRALSDAGFRVVAEKPDGLSGWQSIQKESPDVAVLHIGLPGIDGCRIDSQGPRGRARLKSCG